MGEKEKNIVRVPSQVSASSLEPLFRGRKVIVASLFSSKEASQKELK